VQVVVVSRSRLNYFGTTVTSLYYSLESYNCISNYIDIIFYCHVSDDENRQCNTRLTLTEVKTQALIKILQPS